MCAESVIFGKSCGATSASNSSAAAVESPLNASCSTTACGEPICCPARLSALNKDSLCSFACSASLFFSASIRTDCSLEMPCPNRAWISVSLINFTANSGSFPARMPARVIFRVFADDASRLPNFIEAPQCSVPSNNSMLVRAGHLGSSSNKRGICSTKACGTWPSLICSGSLLTSAHALKRSRVSSNTAGGGWLTTCSLRNASSPTPLATRTCSSVASESPSAMGPSRRMRVGLSHSSGRSSSVFQPPAPLCSSLG